MYLSYVDLYSDKISGLSLSADKIYEKGTTFTLSYQDITHIDRIGNDIIVLHTANDCYKAQTFQCAEKVISLIQIQKEKLS